MADSKQIQGELEQLQLEEARAVAQERSQVRAQRKSRNEAIEASLRRDAANQERIQAACWHRKGGKGAGQMFQGHDSNFSVVTHTLAHGITIVVCQRCGHKWEPPERLTKGATKEQKEVYQKLLTEYRWARNLPTDNEPSGSTLFTFESADEAAA